MPIQPREISSKTRAKDTMSAARPPYSAGTVRPNRPNSRMRVTISVGLRPDSSHSWATGSISFATKSRRVRRNSFCSGVKVKSTAQGSGSEGGAGAACGGSVIGGPGRAAAERSAASPAGWNAGSILPSGSVRQFSRSD